MNPTYSHPQSWAPCSTAVHASFSDVQQHLEDHSLVFEEMFQSPQFIAEPKGRQQQKPKAKVLFQFFDGWPMSDS